MAQDQALVVEHAGKAAAAQLQFLDHGLRSFPLRAAELSHLEHSAEGFDHRLGGRHVGLHDHFLDAARDTLVGVLVDQEPPEGEDQGLDSPHQEGDQKRPPQDGIEQGRGHDLACIGPRAGRA
jgi:hypothetical protein